MTATSLRRLLLLMFVACFVLLLAGASLCCAGGFPVPEPRDYIDGGFWGTVDDYQVPMPEVSHAGDCPEFDGITRAFAGMNKATLPKAGAAYRDRQYDTALKLLEDRLDEPLDDRIREEAELLIAKCYLRKVQLDTKHRYDVQPDEIINRQPGIDPVPLDEAEKRFRAFLQTAEAPYYLREARGWLAHIDWLHGRTARAAKYYMDQLLDPCSIYSQWTLWSSMNKCRFNAAAVARCLDTPKHALVLLHFATSWWTNEAWHKWGDEELIQNILEVAAGKPELFRTGARSADLALIFMKTALYRGDVEKALSFSEYLARPISPNLIPEIMWIRACCHVLQGNLELAETDLLTMRDAATSSEAKDQALIGLMSIYHKQNKAEELLRMAATFALRWPNTWSLPRGGGGYAFYSFAEHGVHWMVEDLYPLSDMHLSIGQLRDYLKRDGRSIPAPLRNQLTLGLGARLVCAGRYDEAAAVLETLQESSIADSKAWARLPNFLARFVLTKEIYDAPTPSIDPHSEVLSAQDAPDMRTHAGRLLLETAEHSGHTSFGRMIATMARDHLQNETPACLGGEQSQVAPARSFPHLVEPPPPPEPGERMELNGIGDVLMMSDDGRYRLYAPWIIWDTKTDLEWYPLDDTAPWDVARSPVKKYNMYGGGWRLPTRAELQSFATEEQCYPIHGFAFLTPLISRYLTIRESKDESNSTDLLTYGWAWSDEERDVDTAWGFNFMEGKTGQAGFGQHRSVFLVRLHDKDDPSRANARPRSRATCCDLPALWSIRKQTSNGTHGVNTANGKTPKSGSTTCMSMAAAGACPHCRSSSLSPRNCNAATTRSPTSSRL